MIVLSDIELKMLEECDAGCLRYTELATSHSADHILRQHTLKEIRALQEVIAKHNDGWAYATKMDKLRQVAETEIDQLYEALWTLLGYSEDVNALSFASNARWDRYKEARERIYKLLPERQDDTSK